MTTPFAHLSAHHPAAGSATPERLTSSARRHWLLVVTLIWGIFVGLPWLAPVLMRIGWTDAGQAVYTAYSFTCHQLPERSYFLFGPKAMYSLEEIQSAWQITNNPIILRRFIGNEALGWKVAWSDRMVSLYTSVLLGLVILGVFRQRLPRLPIWAFVVLLTPMALDGSSHALSDVLGGGVGLGFRDSNVWLAALTSSALPPSFYVGDALGSFNWLMRLVTGSLMGLAVVWVLFPTLDDLTSQGTPGKVQRHTGARMAAPTISQEAGP